MSKATHALAFAAGTAIGFLAMAVVYAECFWQTCRNKAERGFECSRCGSHTDYEPIMPFRVCPMCGAYVVRRERI